MDVKTSGTSRSRVSAESKTRGGAGRGRRLREGSDVKEAILELESEAERLVQEIKTLLSVARELSRPSHRDAPQMRGTESEDKSRGNFQVIKQAQRAVKKVRNELSGIKIMEPLFGSVISIQKFTQFPENIVKMICEYQSISTIVLMGGHLHGPTSECITLSPYTHFNSYNRFPSLTTPRKGFGSGMVNNRIYIFGGCRGMSEHAPIDLNSTEVFKLRETSNYNFPDISWNPGPSMIQTRRFFASGAVGSALVAAGGWARVSGTDYALDTIEVLYDDSVVRPAGNEGWKVIGNLHYARGNCFGTSTYHEGRHSLYIAGGVGETDTVLDSVERVEIKDGKARIDIIHPMIRARFGACACWLRNHLYVIGGYNYSQPDTPITVEVYNPAEDKWAMLNKTLNHPRVNAVCCVVETKIYIFGGLRRNTETSVAIQQSSSEYFDLENPQRK
ncbi:hypothetical protein AAMO2058_001239600 [Amorphochlora amoebiformis]